MSKGNVFPNRRKDRRPNKYKNLNQSNQKNTSGQRRVKKQS